MIKLTSPNTKRGNNEAYILLFCVKSEHQQPTHFFIFMQRFPVASASCSLVKYEIERFQRCPTTMVLRLLLRVWINVQVWSILVELGARHKGGSVGLCWLRTQACCWCLGQDYSNQRVKLRLPFHQYNTENVWSDMTKDAGYFEITHKCNGLPVQYYSPSFSM